MPVAVGATGTGERGALHHHARRDRRPVPVVPVGRLPGAHRAPPGREPDRRAHHPPRLHGSRTDDAAPSGSGGPSAPDHPGARGPTHRRRARRAARLGSRLAVDRGARRSERRGERADRRPRREGHPGRERTDHRRARRHRAPGDPRPARRARFRHPRNSSQRPSPRSTRPIWSRRDWDRSSSTQIARGSDALSSGVPHGSGASLPTPAGVGAGLGAWVTNDDVDDPTLTAAGRGRLQPGRPARRHRRFVSHQRIDGRDVRARFGKGVGHRRRVRRRPRGPLHRHRRSGARRHPARLRARAAVLRTAERRHPPRGRSGRAERLERRPHLRHHPARRPPEQPDGRTGDALVAVRRSSPRPHRAGVAAG